MKYIIILLIIVFMGGCVNKQKEFTLEEKIELGEKNNKSSKKEYKNISKIDLIKAIEKVFELSDGKDYILNFDNNTVIANRTSILYLVFSVSIDRDKWIIKLTEQKDSILVEIDLYRGQQVMLTNMGDYSFKNHPTAYKLFELFFTRVDYLLGLSEKWITCKEVDLNHMTDITYYPLCYLANDEIPINK